MTKRKLTTYIDLTTEEPIEVALTSSSISNHSAARELRTKIETAIRAPQPELGINFNQIIPLLPKVNSMCFCEDLLDDSDAPELVRMLLERPYSENAFLVFKSLRIYCTNSDGELDLRFIFRYLLPIIDIEWTNAILSLKKGFLFENDKQCSEFLAEFETIYDPEETDDRNIMSLIYKKLKEINK